MYMRPEKQLKFTSDAYMGRGSLYIAHSSKETKYILLDQH